MLDTGENSPRLVDIEVESAGENQEEKVVMVSDCDGNSANDNLNGPNNSAEKEKI